MPSNFHTKFHPIISKSGMRLEVLMGNKISEKFVLTNEGSLFHTRQIAILVPFLMGR
jgi:hypothetical protein